ncbi:MAG: DUF4369 domain-containing protein, partial [Lutibacter sp.]
MKNLLILLLLTLIFSCNENTKPNIENVNKEYSINATIENLKDSLTVVLTSIDWRNRGSIDIDSTFTFNGTFNFKGESLNPSYYVIILKNYKEKEGKAVYLWLNKGETLITGNYEDFENSTIKGSQLNEFYKQYLNLEPKDRLDFIYKNPDNYFSLSTIMENPEWISNDSLKLYYSKLNTELKNSENGLALNDFITTDKIKIGDHFKDFE